MSLAGMTLQSTITTELGATSLSLHHCVINGVNTDKLNLPSNTAGILPSPSTNPNGKAFVIFMLPLVDPSTFSKDNAGRTTLTRLCAKAGLRPVVSDGANCNWKNHEGMCTGQYHCMPLGGPCRTGRGGGNCKASTCGDCGTPCTGSVAVDWVHATTGWDDLVAFGCLLKGPHVDK